MKNLTRFLTTTQAAKLASVGHKTIIRWIDTEAIPGFKIPGSGGHRRVDARELEKFLRANGMPVPEALTKLARDA